MLVILASFVLNILRPQTYYSVTKQVSLWLRLDRGYVNSQPLGKQGQLPISCKNIYTHTFVTFVCNGVQICIIFIFKYFPKIPLEMSYTHHFQTILIPICKMFILFVGSKKKNLVKRFVKRFFSLKQKNYFVLGVTKVL